MPYRTGARITITNDSDVPLSHIFYDIDFTQGETHPADMLYFHAHWRRERWTTFKEDFEILPKINGGGPNHEIMKMRETGTQFEPVTVDSGGYDKFTKLYEERNPPKLGDEDFPRGHVNVYRQDDYAATAFFYLDAPTSTLPALAPVKARIEGL